MANVKDLKKKIKSVKGTLKITTAMKLVSAAKLARAQLAITSSKPYATELEETIDIISALIIGPASRSLLIFWNLKEGFYNYNITHPPFYLRCKFISELLIQYGHIDSENEKIATEIVEQLYEEPKQEIYQLAIEIIEDIMENLFKACIDKIPSTVSTIKKIIEFLKEDNPQTETY